MNDKVKATPDGYHTATAYLIVNDAARAIEFYKQVFGATETMRFDHQGKVGHAEIKIGDSAIMLADEYLDMGIQSPTTLHGSPVSIVLYVDDVDAVVAKAIQAGATLQRPIENKFYGDRSGSVEDPFGHVWHVATHIEDVPPEQLQERAATEMDKMG